MTLDVANLHVLNRYMYLDEAGALHPRENLIALSEKVNAELFKGKASYIYPQDNPLGPPNMTFIAGGNGAGKTTFLFYLQHRNLIPLKEDISTIYIQNSSFTKRVPEIKNPETDRDAFFEEGGDYIVMYLQKQAVKEAVKRNLMIIGDHQLPFLKDTAEMTQIAKDAGYPTGLVAVTLSPEIYYDRVERRQEETGRNATHNHYYQRHVMLAKNICAIENSSHTVAKDAGTRAFIPQKNKTGEYNLLSCFDVASVFDNSHEVEIRAKQHGEKQDNPFREPMLTAETRNGKTSIIIHEPEQYKKLRLLAAQDLETMAPDNRQATLAAYHHTTPPEIGSIEPYFAYGQTPDPAVLQKTRKSHR